MIIDHLNKLKKDGIYKELIQGGIISLKVDLFMDVYNYYNRMLIVNENRKDTIMQSITDTGIKFECCDTTVRSAIKLMQKTSLTENLATV